MRTRDSLYTVHCSQYCNMLPFHIRLPSIRFVSSHPPPATSSLYFFFAILPMVSSKLSSSAFVLHTVPSFPCCSFFKPFPTFSFFCCRFTCELWPVYIILGKPRNYLNNQPNFDGFRSKKIRCFGALTCLPTAQLV